MKQNKRFLWNDSKIIECINKVVKALELKTMPTHTEMYEVYGDYRLSNAISKHGGTKKFADLLGLPIKNCESKLGEYYEIVCANEIEDKLGYCCEKTKPRYPYDILVGNCVKVDVKAAKIYRTPTGSEFHSFNLEKNHQTCDIFVCYCLDNDLQIIKTLVIPSVVLSGNNQLSVGETSRYDKYIDAWHFVSEYYEFMQHSI